MKARLLIWVLVAGCLALVGCQMNQRTRGRSELRPLPSTEPGVRRFEFVSSCYNYPDGAKSRLTNLQTWLAANGITEYQIVTETYVVTENVLGTETGEVFYTIKARASQ